MNDKLPLIVQFEFKQDEIEFMKKELKKILKPSRNEEGCLIYELHQDRNNPCVFIFYEVWETKEAWIAHDNMPYITVFKSILNQHNVKSNVQQLKII